MSEQLEVSDVERAGTTGGSPGRRTLRWRYLPVPTVLADLRHRVRSALTGWGILGRAAHDIVLVVNELVSNAIEHARTPLLVALSWDGHGVQVRVRDYSPDPPVLQAGPLDSPRGRGLRIVASLGCWGWEPHPDGKTVWVSIPHPS